jgi:hypothetical protein
MLAAKAASAYARGYAYERAVQQTLQRIGCFCDLVGKSGDAGIDLVGELRLPATPAPARHDKVVVAITGEGTSFPIVVQCKRSTQPVSQTMIRDFAFVLSQRPAHTLGVFASSSGFRLSSRIGSALPLLPRPTLLLHILEDGSISDARFAGRIDAHPGLFVRVALRL